MSLEAKNDFPSSRERFYGIKFELKALTCCDPEDLPLFGETTTRVFCGMADKDVCAEKAEDGLCVRMNIYLSLLRDESLRQRRRRIVLTD